jgi:GrpB-like predicted nucleotidyltransferase (UPF0157 family)
MFKMENNTIVVVPYSDSWAITFQQLATVLNNRLKDFIISIEHVGSTSVPGLAAKPIIDLDILIKDKSQSQQVISILGELGYTHRGDLGIPGREAFFRDSDQTPIDGAGTQWPAHHLYVCLEDSMSLKNHLRFRDFLRAHPETALQYGALKSALAAKYPNDIDNYVEGKTAFITAVLAQTGFDQDILNNITLQNKAPR